MSESNLLENYLNLEALLHRYFAWKRRKQGPHANPHRGQGRILSVLKLQPEISQKEMTYLLDMRPQSLGELLTKLEKAGFITREPSENDRRVMIIKLTDAGAEEVEKMNQTDEDPIFDSLTDEEKAQFEAIIEKLIAAVEKELPEEMGTGYPHGKDFGGFEGHGFGDRGMKDFGRGHGMKGFGPRGGHGRPDGQPNFGDAPFGSFPGDFGGFPTAESEDEQ